MYCWSYSKLYCWSYSTLCIVGLTLHCVLLVLLNTVYCWSYSTLCLVGLTQHCVLLVLLCTVDCWSYSALCIVGLTLHCVLLVLLCTVYCWSDSTLGIVGLTLSGLGKLPLGGILLLSELYGMNKLLLEDLGTPQNSRLCPKKKGRGWDVTFPVSCFPQASETERCLALHSHPSLPLHLKFWKASSAGGKSSSVSSQCMLINSFPVQQAANCHTQMSIAAVLQRRLHTDSHKYLLTCRSHAAVYSSSIAKTAHRLTQVCADMPETNTSMCWHARDSHKYVLTCRSYVAVYSCSIAKIACRLIQVCADKLVICSCL